MGETVLKEFESAKSSASPSCLAQRLGSCSSACSSAWLSSRGKRDAVMGDAMQSAVEEMSMFLLEWQLLIHKISSLTALSFAMPFVTSAIYFVCVS